MKIYLVTPRNPPSFWTYDRILPTLEKRCIFPNLSMPTLAGLTHPDHEVVLCDENVEAIDFDVEADIVGVTGYIVHKQRMLEIIDAFRSRGRFVVVGGPYASLCPEELAGRCDVLFVDEAEETWPVFLADFAAGSWKTEYRAAEKPDLTLSPMPRFDLLDVSRYHALTIQFARGCPFNCEFCDIIVMYGRRPRAKSVRQVIAEIDECRRLGANQVFVVDDNFIGNKKLAKDLLREIGCWGRAHGYPIDFNTEVSLNVAADDELLELLRAANFTTLFIGIESPRRASLLETGKTQNTRADLVESVRKIQSYGIQIQAGMIVGFDNDDASIFAEQLRFIQDARIPVSMTGLLQALPKTPLHRRVEEEGRLLLKSLGDQFVLSNILPKRMTRLELYRGYRWLLQQLYDFRNYRERTLAFLLNRGGQVAGGLNLRAGDLRRLVRILRDTVLRAGPRRAWFTLSLIGAALLRRPSALKEAVSFAIVHRAFHEYLDALVLGLDAAIAELEREAAEVVPAPGAPALSELPR
ncbi:MAG: B12-binding domain-containing radical SAM protein [Myxococcales bacterium]|nr:B12-binding domain-containing radical SAM protein [Myxococcales bacterium]MDH5307314.1 B12-binding domain-containing radical SAM protein [Myxococcales bacterium]